MIGHPRFDVDVLAEPSGDILSPFRARDVAAALAAALAVDISARAARIGWGETLAVAVVAGGLLSSGRLRQPQSRAAALLAVLFGAWAAIRTSPWIVPLDLASAFALLILAVAFAERGDVSNTSLPALLARVQLSAALVYVGPIRILRAHLLRSRFRLRVRSDGTVRALRGVLIAVPLIAVLTLLLASADAVFAQFFRFPTSPQTLLVHAVLFATGGWIMLGLASAASAGAMPDLPSAGKRLSGTEAIVVLAALDALFLLFAASQMVALSGGGQRVIETAGLTYAGYARSGYFQLLAVAGITLVTLLGLRALTAFTAVTTRRRFTMLALLSVALTLMIVLLALRRLHLYEDAFGLTMLRLSSEVFAWWLAALFVLLGMALAGLGSSRTWFPTTALGAALVALMALNIANPESIVVRHNIDHAGSVPLDPSYLTQLSDDAVPTLVEGLDRLDPATRADVLDLLCRRSVEDDGVWNWNRARARAADAIRQACVGRR